MPPSQKRKVDSCLKSMLPKQRTAYALFLEANFPVYKAQLTEEEKQGRFQHIVVKRVSAKWKDLPQAEKEIWERRAKQEHEQRATSRDQLLTVEPDEAGEEAMIGPSVVGEYKVAEEPLWTGASVTAFLAQHRVWMSKGCALVFKNEDDFKKQVKVLRSIKLESSIFFAKLLQATTEDSPIHCVVQEHHPLICGFRPVSGQMLMASCKQVALALTTLHKMDILLCDIRPGAIMWDQGACCAKLFRFALACTAGEHVLDRFPYSSGYRAPELWAPLQSGGGTATRSTEAWAFSVTMAELMLNEHLFAMVGDILGFQAKKHKEVKPMSKLPEWGRFVVLKFLDEAPANRLSLEDFVQSEFLLSKLAQVVL